MYCLYITLDNIVTLCYNINKKRGVDMESDSKYIMGRLGYNSENERYGLLVSDLWEHTGFHCGEGLQVMVDDKWVDTCMEMAWEKDGQKWYLVGTPYKGDLEYIRARIER